MTMRPRDHRGERRSEQQTSKRRIAGRGCGHGRGKYRGEKAEPFTDAITSRTGQVAMLSENGASELKSDYSVRVSGLSDREHGEPSRAHRDEWEGWGLGW